MMTVALYTLGGLMTFMLLVLYGIIGSEVAAFVHGRGWLLRVDADQILVAWPLVFTAVVLYLLFAFVIALPLHVGDTLARRRRER